ncbi:3-deoxy-7-phosphoheptulonate synthase [Candidatus Pacearchaeota archaeon]|nr:3-deoxy-7-phosphoheptulonate synthase [Candidatus Pacearchaeota archaeon]
MTIRLKKNATKEDKQKIFDVLKENGFGYVEAPGETANLICIMGEETEKMELLELLESFPGVESVNPVNDPYRLVSRRLYPEMNGKTRIIDVDGVKIGTEKPIVIAGPCTIYSLEQALEVAESVKKSRADFFRGGIFKPRTSPYDFQGLGREGLWILGEVKKQTAMPIVTEVMDTRDVELVAEYADILQIGARNMQNHTLLHEAGKQKKPVMLKRHPYSSLQEWLCSAEHIAREGNLNIILCERGIRTSTNGEYDRNTLDLGVIPGAREKSILPIIVDPSHGTGFKKLVPSAAKSALEYGAHGLMIEVMRDNEEPLINCGNKKVPYCDYKQGLTASEFDALCKEIKK